MHFSLYNFFKEIYIAIIYNYCCVLVHVVMLFFLFIDGVTSVRELYELEENALQALDLETEQTCGVPCPGDCVVGELLTFF